MGNVLGLSFFFHDSAAALVVDGQVAAAAAEERFCRRKHTSEFPKRAIEYCLDAAGLGSINEIDAVVFYEKPLLKLDRVVESFVQTWPFSMGAFTTRFPPYLKTKMNPFSTIEKMLPGFKGEILFSDHHQSHAASAFYCSPFDEAAILTVDGVGEWASTTIGVGRGREIRLEQAIRFPHSIGLFYSALTAYLGFRVNDAEWKVMGLAPYGKPKFVEQLRRMVEMREDGSFRLDLQYFSHHYSSTDGPHFGKWQALLGFPSRKPKEDIAAIHEDLASSGQIIVEEVMLNLARAARKLSGSENLVIGGGVGLNSVANWRIEEEKIFKNVWIQPAAGDDGAALGAALLVSQSILRDPPCEEMKDAYLGPSYSAAEIRGYLEMEGIHYEELSDAVLVERVADLIASGMVIGWFRGRMEFGPRALGARSILASPVKAEMKQIINSKIKYREYFRPFAPAIPLEHVHEYFEVPPGTELPFMLKIPQVRADKRDQIPAVTHQDGSGRVQTVTRESNPVYYDLLKALIPRTGVPVAINTSFNVRGEPVVCTPQDAYHCFVSTGIDALVLENFLITTKPGQEINFDRGYARSDELEETGEIRSSAVSQRLISQRMSSAPSNVGESVLSFYKELPFNQYSGALDAAKELLRKNRVKRNYPVLHRHLSRVAPTRLIDVGCGAGWFINSCSAFYPHDLVGLEFNPVALKQAKGVSRLVPRGNQIEFALADLFKYEPAHKFGVVNSLGVLHHTADCHGAIRRILRWIAPDGYLHLGLYHKFGRDPFLAHFAQMRARGASDEALYEEFKALNSDMTDETNLISWFRDQVIHPHETQHTYKEIHDLLSEEGFSVMRTSINHFKPIDSHEELFEKEKGYEALSKKALYRHRRYFPGFFVVWAKANSNMDGNIEEAKSSWKR